MKAVALPPHHLVRVVLEALEKTRALAGVPSMFCNSCEDARPGVLQVTPSMKVYDCCMRIPMLSGQFDVATMVTVYVWVLEDTH
jgi:hypothetical protein